MTLKAGDLVKVGYIYRGCELNNKTAIYLGELAPVGTLKVVNHALWATASWHQKEPYQIIDRGLLKYLKKIG